jgi:Protein of unknown function (DUF3429)
MKACRSVDVPEIAMTNPQRTPNQELARDLPPHVAWLGYGGLLPFIGLAVLIGVDAHHATLWSDALVGYGAVILSFVGALHWGFAMSMPALDPGLAGRAGLAAWYLPLRWRLSVVASLCLLANAWHGVNHA